MDSPTRLTVRYMLALVALVLAACAGKPAQPEAPRAALVAHPQDAREGALEVYAGDVHARYESQLGFRVAGKIKTRRVDIGAQVKKGQALAELDAADYRLQAAGAGAALASARANRDLAQAEYARYRAMFDKHYISQTQFDTIANQLKAAQAQLQQAQSAAAVTGNQADYTQLRADRDGVVTAIAAEAGQVVASGQPIASLAADGEREVEIVVPENRIETYKPGRAAAIEAWAEAGKRLPGHVREISPEADRVTRTYRLRVAFDDAASAPRLGQSARVYFADANDAALVAVPLSALTESERKPALWRVDAQTREVHLIPVTIAAYRDNDVALSAGIGKSDWIVTAGVHKLREGEKIAPLDAQNRPLAW